MRERHCAGCSAAVPEKDGFLLAARFLCPRCLETLAQEAGREKKTLTVERASDPTVCGRCGLDNGNIEHARVAGMPMCPGCTTSVLAWPFPAWLRVSAAVLVALLAAATVRGLPMVGLGLAFVRAERHVDAREYARASDELAKVVAASPQARKATLLKIKADLLCDRFQEIGPLVERMRGERVKGALAGEVVGLLDRWSRAMEAFSKAAAVDKDHYGEAIPHLAKAHETYPESRLLHCALLTAKAGVRFDAKDYDGFLAESEAAVRVLPDDPRTVSQLASALAAKYASSGDAAFKARAEERLTHARSLCADEATRKDFAEYSERIAHRLRTREIIGKDEYDRRFRAPQGETK